MINVIVIMFLALRGFNVYKLVFTNPKFNKMVLKTSGLPLHSTRHASGKKKDQFFQKIMQKLHKMYS